MTEQEIRKIIIEVLNEEIKKYDKLNNGFVFDLSKIPKEELEKQYVDFSKQFSFRSYANPLSKDVNGYLFESFGDVLPSDAVVKALMMEYKLKEWQFKCIEYCNKVSIYILIPDIGDNVNKITADMDRMGYFLGQDFINGNGWRQVNYEPKEQEDNTEEIKEKFKVLLHLTPYYNVDSIMRFGLIPKNANLMYNYPQRVYMLTQNVTEDDFWNLGNGLSTANMDSRNTGIYILLKITLKKVPDDVKFFYDPNMPNAVYTTKGIPSECVEIYQKYRFGVA